MIVAYAMARTAIAGPTSGVSSTIRRSTSRRKNGQAIGYRCRAGPPPGRRSRSAAVSDSLACSCGRMSSGGWCCSLRWLALRSPSWPSRTLRSQDRAPPGAVLRAVCPRPVHHQQRQLYGRSADVCSVGQVITPAVARECCGRAPGCVGRPLVSERAVDLGSAQPDDEAAGSRTLEVQISACRDSSVCGSVAHAWVDRKTPHWPGQVTRCSRAMSARVGSGAEVARARVATEAP